MCDNHNIHATQMNSQSTCFDDKKENTSMNETN